LYEIDGLSGEVSEERSWSVFSIVLLSAMVNMDMVKLTKENRLPVGLEPDPTPNEVIENNLFHMVTQDGDDTVAV
jgi:hypothetical protein